MQIRELEDFVKRSAWKIFNEYTDQGYTGANTKRPAFAKMMFGGREKKIGAVISFNGRRGNRLSFFLFENRLNASFEVRKFVR